MTRNEPVEIHRRGDGCGGKTTTAPTTATTIAPTIAKVVVNDDKTDAERLGKVAVKIYRMILSNNRITASALAAKTKLSVNGVRILLSEVSHSCVPSHAAGDRPEGTRKVSDIMTKTKMELLVVRGSLAGRRFNIAPGGSRLGRTRSCEIEINDPVLSRHHCLFEMVDGSLRLTDLASANGTFVNGMELGDVPSYMR